MTVPDATSVAGLTAASAGITQIVGDLGLQGEWKKIVCVVVSMVLGYIMLYQPALWSALVLPLIGATATGGVSFLKDLFPTTKQPS